MENPNPRGAGCAKLSISPTSTIKLSMILVQTMVRALLNFLSEISLGQRDSGKECSICEEMNAQRFVFRKSMASEDREKLINLGSPRAIRHRRKMPREEQS